jgi:cysteine peptidase C11 family protein
MFRTLLLYVCADNDLSKFADLDISELSSFPVDQYLYVDQRACKWGDTQPNCYRISRLQGVEQRVVVGESNTGDPEVMRAFLSWSQSQGADVEHSLLIMWGHGDGWIGCCQDFTNEDRLDLCEILKALSGFTFKTIGFDACVMATLEVMQAIAPFTEFVLASQEIEPKTGWSYALLKSDIQDIMTYFDSMAGPYVDQPFHKPLCLSLVCLESIPELVGRLNELFKQFVSPWNGFEELCDSLPRIANGEYVDLCTLLDGVAESLPSALEAAKSLRVLIEQQIVLRRYGTNPGYRGMSVWCPKSVPSYKKERYSSLPLATACPAYVEVLNRYMRIRA